MLACVCRIDAGASRGHRAGHRREDGLRLARVRHDADDRVRLQDLVDRHADRLFRHVRHGREPAFADLLLAAGFIEGDDR